MSNFLGGRDQVVIRTGQAFVEEDGTGKTLSLGDIETMTLAVTRDSERVMKPYKGRSVLLKTISKEIGGTVSGVLLNFNPTNLARATMSELNTYTQDAVTDAEVTVENVVAGERTDLGSIRISSATVVDGSLNTLVDGTDYLLNAQTGAIVWIKPQTAATITFSAPAITGTGGETVLNLLNRIEGVRATLHIDGEDSEGNGWKFKGLVGDIVSEGDINLISSDVGKLNFQMELVQGPNPAAPFGQSIEIPKAS